MAAWLPLISDAHQFIRLPCRDCLASWSKCPWFLRGRADRRSLRAGAPVIQRPNRMAPSGSATHKNHGPPLAPLIRQITKKNRLIASQDPQAARHAGENLPGLAWIDPGDLGRAGGGLATEPGGEDFGS